MARRRPTSQPTTTLVHPNDPSITITVRKPTRPETLRRAKVLATHQVALQVYDRDGLAVSDDFGQPRVFVQQQFPLEVVIETLRGTVIAWSGIRNEQDAEIPFSEDRLDMLLEDWLDVEDKDGRRKPLSRWIAEQLARADLFDPDPLAKSSAQP